MRYNFRPAVLVSHLFVAYLIVCGGNPLYAQTSLSVDHSNRDVSGTSVQPDLKGQHERVEAVPITQMQTFGYLIDMVGANDREIHSLLESGRSPQYARRDFSRAMHITPEEDKAMRELCLGAVRRMNEIDAQVAQYRSESGISKAGGRTAESAESEARARDMEQQRPNIYENAIAALRLTLGDDTFNKIGRWILETQFNIVTDLPITDAPMVAAPKVRGNLE